MRKEHIVNLQGKDFVLFAGLLDEAHKKGMCRVRSRMRQEPTDQNGNNVIFEAEVTLKDKDGNESVYEATGDASPKNVSARVATAIIRVAETRAIARALRMATNIGMCSVEELGGSQEEALLENQPAKMTQAQAQAINKELAQRKMPIPEAQAYLKATFNKTATKQLTKDEADTLIAYLKKE